jgi:hypothetical protein
MNAGFYFFKYEIGGCVSGDDGGPKSSGALGRVDWKIVTDVL